MPYVQFVKPVELGNMVDMIQKRIAHYETSYAVYIRVLEVLKPFEGKQFTRRIETAVKKALPGYRIYQDGIASMTHLNVWEGDEKLSFLLCYDSDPYFRMENFLKHNNYMDFPNLVDKLKQGLVMLPIFIDRYNEILKDAQELVVDATQCGMEYDFDFLARNKSTTHD